MIRAATFDRGDLSKEARHRRGPPGHFPTLDSVAVLQESRLKVPQRPESVSEDLGQDASSHGVKAGPINLPQNREEVGSGHEILEPRSLGRQIRTNLLQIFRLHEVIHSLQTVVHLVCRLLLEKKNFLLLTVAAVSFTQSYAPLLDPTPTICPHLSSPVQLTYLS